VGDLVICVGVWLCVVFGNMYAFSEGICECFGNMCVYFGNICV